MSAPAGLAPIDVARMALAEVGIRPTAVRPHGDGLSTDLLAADAVTYWRMGEIVTAAFPGRRGHFCFACAMAFQHSGPLTVETMRTAAEQCEAWRPGIEDCGMANPPP